MSAREDVDTLVMEQQQLMNGKLRNVAAARGADRQSGFDDYRRYLAAHQGAQQSWLYVEPGIRPTPEMAGVQRDGQENAAYLIRQLEQLGIDSDEFDNLFTQLITQTGRLASAERQQLPLLLADATEGETDLMVRALLTVPTMAAGKGHSISHCGPFAFADLLEEAKDFFAAMPLTDPASTSIQEDPPL